MTYKGEYLMLPGARRRALLDYLSQVGSASITDLSKKYHVSSMTIRRDLKLLQQRGLVSLTHGGAIYDVAPFYQIETHRQQRESDRVDEKRAIGRYVATNFVSSDDVLILDSGTTIRAMVPFLEGKTNLTVTTNSLRTLEAICRHLPDCTAFGTGGMLRPESFNFVGPAAERYFENFFVNKAIISGSGFTVQAGLSDTHMLDTALKKAMIHAAETNIVVVDSSKIGTMAMVQVLATDEIRTLVTDSGISDHLRQELLDAGIDVHVAPMPSSSAVAAD